MKRSPSTRRPPPSTASTPALGWRRAACSRRAANGSRPRTRSIARWPPIRRAPTPPCAPGCCITTVSATARPRWSVTGRRSPWILSITVPTTSCRSRCLERAGETRRWQPGAASCPLPKRSVTRPRSMARRPISGRRRAELPADDPQMTSGRDNAAHLRGDQLHRKRGGLVATRVGRADDRDGACRVLDDGRAGERQRNVLARPNGGAGDIEHLGILVQLAHDVHGRDVGRRDREIELAEQHVRPRVERERAGNRGGGVRHRRLLLERPQRDGASGWARRTRGTRIALEPRRARGPCGAGIASRSGSAGRAGRTRGTLTPGVALRTRGPCRALAASWTRRPSWALGAGWSLRTGGARCSRSTLRARVALVTLWPLASRRTHRSLRTRPPDVSNRTHRAGWPRRASWRSRRARGARRARLSGRPGLTVRARRPVRTRLTILSVLSRGADEPEVLDVDLSLLLGAEPDAHEERAVLLLTQHARLGVRPSGSSHDQCHQRSSKSEDESSSQRDHRMARVPGDVTEQCCPGQWFLAATGLR